MDARPDIENIVDGAEIAADIEGYLARHERKELLRFITCGSVDDGKSTLIGRMLYESKMIFEDQLAAIERDSKTSGTQGDKIDFALLVDGLASEREQGITIDVAYRFFSTEKRKFIVADTPGHEQYTRNMATGASTADLAILLIDARKGVLTQTRRHAYITGLLGIRRVVLAVNKMDLVGYDQATFEAIVADYRAFAARLPSEGCLEQEVTAIPMSALEGANIVDPSPDTPWYDGPTLLRHLEAVPVGEAKREAPFRLPVQWVNRPNLDFRGFAGRVASGALSVGEPVRALPSGRVSKVKALLDADREASAVQAGQSVTVVLEDEIDVSRGDMLVAADNPPEVAGQFEATVIWMSGDELLPGRSYAFKSSAFNARAQVTSAKYKTNVNTLEHLDAGHVELNDIARCNISLDRRMPFDPYAENRETGSFILVDRLSNETVGAGLIHFALRRSGNIHWQATDVSREARARQKGQRPAVLWFTGLSGSGKSTIANILEKKLVALDKHTTLLDGDNVRHGLNRDLGFTDVDRVENIRRVSEVAKLMTEAGLIALVSFISPFRSERRMAREIMGDVDFMEIHVDTPLAVAEQRDVKGLYAKARAGEIKNFTGIDSPYEEPENPELRVSTTHLSAEEAADLILVELEKRGTII